MAQPPRSAFGRRLARFRALASFHVVALAQFLCPSAAADPASRIDPPTWTTRAYQDQLQAPAGKAAAAGAGQEVNREGRQTQQVRMDGDAP
jgi:hypothetical protein